MSVSNFHRFIAFLFIFISVYTYPQTKSKAYIDYIKAYHELASIQQNEHGIPASITLAQGLLESGAGLSEFVKNSNNHFGIKCHDWTGDRYFHDDDSKNECFRKYASVLESYEDHSLFLRNKPRYAFLFDLSPTDYEGWAHGLKKAGYATDPTYAYKLIAIIENYELHTYDLNKNPDYRKVKENSREESLISSGIGTIEASMHHQLYKNNGVRYVIAMSGDSYGSIGDEFNIDEAKLRKFNEINNVVELNAGTQVYLQGKRNKAGKEYTSHVVVEGETMYQIAQMYAIKTEKLYLLNQKPFDEGAQVGEVLRLR